MNGEFKRGEVYWARMDNGWGSEQSASRPVVIVSSDQGNATCPTVMGVFMTTKLKFGRISVQTDVTGYRSWIMCNQIRTLDKERLTYIGCLSYEEMMEVDTALRVAMALEGGESKGEIEKLEARIKELEAQVAGFEEEKTKIAVENTVKADMWQKLYDKAIDELVNVKITADVDRLMKAVPSEAPKVVEKVEAPKVEEKVADDVVEKVAEKPIEEEPKPIKVEINTCSEADLKRVGCNARQIANIISHRPYKSVEGLRNVPWVTNTAYAILKTKVCCIPIVEKPKFKMKPVPESVKVSRESNVVVEKAPVKVNINTASAEEISAVTGLGAETAKLIVRYRKHNGLFKRVEDVCNVDRFGPRSWKHYGDKLEV